MRQAIRNTGWHRRHSDGFVTTLIAGAVACFTVTGVLIVLSSFARYQW
jgi:hypothetical protein